MSVEGRMRRLAMVVLVMAGMCYGSTVIEKETPKPLKRTGSLGTCGYKPRSAEEKYAEKLDKSERLTGSFMDEKPYTIHKKKGVYISWFAIVRGVARDEKAENQYRLLLEHKFFDGLTDCHIMLVSAAGDGDFEATLVSDNIDSVPLLSLVRVYGRVIEEKERVPHVEADYIRVWPWYTFTLTDLGPQDHGNPKWRKLCKPCQSGRVYNPYPTEGYYKDVLGDPKASEPEIGAGKQN